MLALRKTVLSTFVFLSVFSGTAQALYQDPGVLEDYEFQSDPVVNGGSEASASDVLSQSTVWIESLAGSTCSGTLIAPDLVMTAGHCLVGREQVVLRIRYKDQSYISLENTLRVHPKFSIDKIFFGLAGKKASNDIGLIFLTKKVPAFFKPASLPAREVLFSEQKVVIAGFGRTFYDKKKEADSGVLRWGAQG